MNTLSDIRKSTEKAAIQEGKKLYLEVVVVNEDEAKKLMSEVSLGHEFFGCKFISIAWINPVQAAKDKILAIFDSILDEDKVW